MKEFDRLFEVIRTLRGPNGCPWDKEQTKESMVANLIEETYETAEAIEVNNAADLEEELGDMFFLVLFIAYLGEQSGLFTVSRVLDLISDKLIRRHPHVFGGIREANVDKIIQNWEAIKSEEVKNQKRKSPLDGIPHNLPDIQKFFKIQDKLKRAERMSAAVSEEELKTAFDKLFSGNPSEGPEQFLELFLRYSWQKQIDLSQIIRNINRQTINKK